MNSIDIINDIKSNILRIPITDYSIEFPNEWTFLPDNHLVRARPNYSMVLLRSKSGEPIGICALFVNPAYNNLEIDWVQKLSKVIDPKWFEVLLDRVVVGTMPLLESGELKTIRLRGLVNALSNVNYAINELKKLKEKSLTTGIDYPDEEYELKKDLELYNSILNNYKMIRDRYFDENGLLNHNRKRVSGMKSPRKITPIHNHLK